MRSRATARLSLCALLCALPALADPAPAFLVKDVDTVPVGFPEVAPPFLGPLVSRGGEAYFPATTNETGVELWKSNGTAETTLLVKDVSPGVVASSPDPFGWVGGALLFSALRTDLGRELWRTDGTAAGTSVVSDISPGSGDGFASEHALIVNGALVFGANDGTSGAELWRSDGTAAGTSLVQDILPGATSSSPRYFVKVNGTAFFQASDGTSGSELWKSDGTGGGTALVKDIRPGAIGSSPVPLADVNGALFFTASDGVSGNELWISDGTSAGTVLVKDIRTGANGSNPSAFAVVDGTFFFAAVDDAGFGLWRSDGTGAGTEKVAAVASADETLYELTSVGDRVFYWTNPNYSSAELWTSDGTGAGTVSLGVLGPLEDGGEGWTHFYLTDVGGTLFFASGRSSFGGDVELWKSDGTTAGTVRVKDIVPGSVGSDPTLLGEMNGQVWFSAADADGRQLWRSDGSEAGTVPFTEFAWTRSSDPDGLTDVNGTLLFFPGNGDREPWKSDGTAAGTVLVKDIRAGGHSLNVFCCALNVVQFVNVNGTAFFPASVPGTSGTELWRTDGTEAGTVLVKDVGPGTASGNPGELVNVNGTLFFRATDGSPTPRLWKSDGTSAGTDWVQAVEPTRLTDFSGTLLFSGFNDLWRSDGTPQGTVSVHTAAPTGSRAVAAGTFFYSSSGDLWKSDGTTVGTELVKEYPNNLLSRITAVGSSVFFLADDDIHGLELWKSDGTTAGTVLVKDIVPGAAGTSFAFANSFAVVGGTAFFGANDGVHGVEPWKSDGTEAGTVMVKDLRPGPASSPIGEDIVAVGSAVVFRGWDDASGDELWATDGTEQNTHRVADIAPGSAGSRPEEFVASGSLVYFEARTNATGGELFAVPIAALMDSDLDGLDYAAETSAGTDPFDADSDNDSLSDGAEVNTYGTNPLLADSDGDGFMDGVEVAAGTDPLDPNDLPPPIPLTGPWGYGVLAALLLAGGRAARRATRRDRG